METPRKTIWWKARPLNANLELEFRLGCLVVMISLKKQKKKKQQKPNKFNLFKVVCSYNREEGKVTFSKGKLVEKIHFLKSEKRGGPLREHCKGECLSWQPELACCQRGENSAPLVISHSHTLSLLSQSHCPQTCQLSIHRLPCFLLFWNPGMRRQRRKSGFAGFWVPALSLPLETGRRRTLSRLHTPLRCQLLSRLLCMDCSSALQKPLFCLRYF